MVYLLIGRGIAFSPDWVMLTVKQPSVGDGLLGELRRLTAGGVPLLALQNGIGHMELLWKRCRTRPCSRRLRRKARCGRILAP